jgi:hypothetical protein
MSIGYVVDGEENLIISVWNEVVTFDAWSSNVQQLVNDPKFSSANKYLVDMRFGSADLTIGEKQIKDMAKLIERRNLKNPFCLEVS